jgi:hypothetical protein
MFEEDVILKTEDRSSRMEDGGSLVARRACCNHRLSIFNFRGLGMLMLAILACLPARSQAQQNWYYHTIHSSSLALQYGRTVKLTYANQTSRNRQFKLSAYYFSDEFDLGEDRVKSDMYNLNLEFQYHLIRFGRAFVNGHAGLGGYYLQAKNLIDQKYDETKFSFIGGFQGEFFIQKGVFALVFDYDVLLTPWSDVYEFLHMPRAGLAWTF